MYSLNTEVIKFFSFSFSEVPKHSEGYQKNNLDPRYMHACALLEILMLTYRQYFQGKRKKETKKATTCNLSILVVANNVCTQARAASG